MRRGQRECVRFGFLNRAAGVSLVVMVVDAILGTIQEVICRRAGDGEHRATKTRLNSSQATASATQMRQRCTEHGKGRQGHDFEGVKYRCCLFGCES